MAALVVEEGEAGAVGNPAHLAEGVGVREQLVGDGDLATGFDVEQVRLGDGDAVSRLQVVVLVELRLQPVAGCGLDVVNGAGVPGLRLHHHRASAVGREEDGAAEAVLLGTVGGERDLEIGLHVAEDDVVVADHQRRLRRGAAIGARSWFTFPRRRRARRVGAHPREAQLLLGHERSAIGSRLVHEHPRVAREGVLALHLSRRDVSVRMTDSSLVDPEERERRVESVREDHLGIPAPRATARQALARRQAEGVRFGEGEDAHRVGRAVELAHGEPLFQQQMYEVSLQRDERDRQRRAFRVPVKRLRVDRGRDARFVEQRRHFPARAVEQDILPLPIATVAAIPQLRFSLDPVRIEISVDDQPLGAFAEGVHPLVIREGSLREEGGGEEQEGENATWKVVHTGRAKAGGMLVEGVPQG